MEAVLIFPHHLFEFHPGLKKDRPIFLIEDPRFFSDFNFHKQKLIFHRASLKEFEVLLKKKGYQTHYVEGDASIVIKKLRISILHVVELDDSHLKKRLLSFTKKLKIKLQVAQSPGFITSLDQFEETFQGKKRIRCETFYIHQRKVLNLLLDKKGKPIGGKWSFDLENRKKPSKSLKIPKPFKIRQTKTVKEAIRYVEQKYPENPGDAHHFDYPTTHAQAKKALTNFLQKRLNLFGDYEDAILQGEKLLFHSCFSLLLNTGLLTPNFVIQEVLEYSRKHAVPFNSLEGFIRQVIGWREFVRGVYHKIGSKQRKGNFFHHTKKLPKSFYDGTTGIIPVDEMIQKLQQGAYLHHIERLMILGNFFLLCEINPNDIYRWFMELFIDAYDWVMVPNVYGMSQYADGGMITTKPYFSSSNYILKMSNFPRGDWCEIWDSLFWRFLIKNIKFFKKQPRLSFLCKMAEKKKKDRAFLKIADDFLTSLYASKGSSR